MTVPPGEYAASPKLNQESLVRRQISRYSGKTLGIKIMDQQGPADPDSMAVEVFLNTIFDDSEGTSVISGTWADGTISREDTGVFIVELEPQFTADPGLVNVHWTYVVNNTEFSYVDYYEILDPMPNYDGLSEAQKGVIEQVTWMMGDLFDSTTGGPHLIEEFQTHYGYERLAQLLTVAVNRINVMGQPLTSFVVGASPGQQFPEQYANVMMMALYIETIRHFIRSYVEQPNIVGGTNVAYADRRDYMMRWQSVLQSELDDFKSAVRFFKRKQMNLGQGSFIVAGGIFATNRTFKSGGYAAATRGGRFMPTTFVFNQGHY